MIAGVKQDGKKRNARPFTPRPCGERFGTGEKKLGWRFSLFMVQEQACMVPKLHGHVLPSKSLIGSSLVFN
jgi:hypothetical protein